MTKSCLAAHLFFDHFFASILLFSPLLLLYYPLLYSANKPVTVLPSAHLLAALLAISFQVGFATESQSWLNFFLKLDIFSSTFDNKYTNVKRIALCFCTTNILLILLLLSASKNFPLHHIQSSID